MRLAALIARYGQAMADKYAHRLLPGHRHALSAMLRCRTAEAGEMVVHCTGCGQRQWRAHSCGHRSCPQCQNHEVSQWLARQREKLLPVVYFLVTFTSPAQLRPLAFSHQRAVYAALFAAATDALKAFGLNPRHLGARLGMTAVLHTHSRSLDYHPHVHIVVPGGGVDRDRRVWKRTRGEYLFNTFALARVFRAKFLDEITLAGLVLPAMVPTQWVVDCAPAGKGEPALEYLSRYLYRGVIAESNIIADENGQVTFRYIDSDSDEARMLTLSGEDFLWRVIQHVLPRGFRRVRDYGFLHHNARKQLQLVQLILHVKVRPRPPASRPGFVCDHCGEVMVIILWRHYRGGASAYQSQGPPST